MWQEARDFQIRPVLRREGGRREKEVEVKGGMGGGEGRGGKKGGERKKGEREWREREGSRDADNQPCAVREPNYV